MGPHPGRRPILTLKGVAKPAAPPMAPPPLPSPSKPALRSIAAKTPRQLARTQAVQWLRQTYPAAFGLEVKPLALGVDRLVWPHAEAAGISRRALSDAIRLRTTLIVYFDALTRDGAMRCDLAGVAVEPVCSEHRHRAIEMKAERLAWARKSPRP